MQFLNGYYNDFKKNNDQIMTSHYYDDQSFKTKKRGSGFEEKEGIFFSEKEGTINFPAAGAMPLRVIVARVATSSRKKITTLFLGQ